MVRQQGSRKEDSMPLHRTRSPAAAAVLLALAAGAAAAGDPGFLGEGRFGKAVEGGDAPRADGNDAYARPPITVECWAKLAGKGEFNILVADEPKESSDHWEIYTYAGSGFFSAYLPGYAPAENVSGIDITDGRWHHVAMVFDGARVRLHVDGKEVLSNEVKRAGAMERRRGALTFGTVVAGHGRIGCDGWIDEVRISSVARKIAGVPEAPPEADGDTIGLWRFDAVDGKGEIEDLSRLRNPARVDPRGRMSLDAIDRESFRAGPAPLDTPAEEIALEEGTWEIGPGRPSLSLDGDWEMAPGGDEAARLSGDWPDAIPARVPGSVHEALRAAGRIPDPKFGRNDAVAHDRSFETWWLRRRFEGPRGWERERLVFGGVAIRGTFWLNGALLGTHEGMFGGPEFDVAGKLRGSNQLVVRIDPAPGDRKAWNNPDWRKTVVFNNVWGWHYSSIPALGIWRPVRIEGAPAVRLAAPFASARDAARGIVDLAVGLEGAAGATPGRLLGTIAPENFEGKRYRFSREVAAAEIGKTLHLRVAVPGPRPWWPNGLGRPDLYRLRLAFVPGGSGAADAGELTFGIRTIEMAPLPGGPRPRLFDWTFVVNGRPIFVKGTGWCTMDSSMDFSRERYDRFLSLARLQNVQMLRGWGSGMPETDEFYDLCDRKGLLVLQEWPTAWDSHLVQPHEVLEETVRRNTVRLRSHPSLAMYGGGNESGNPFGKAIDMMGRLSIELDGTRPFHRGEPWGGSAHNYNCYWGWQPLDHNLVMTSSFFGEFGLACMPVLESVLRYLPEEEKGIWPPPPGGSLAHHTPIFDTAEDVKRLLHYARLFTLADSLESFVIGSQLSQAVGVRHTLERARARWPHCTGALYYKLNDNYPAASWSSVDWYGAPKIGHSFFQDAFEPLHACVLFDATSLGGKSVSLPVFLLDDADALAGSRWEVRVRAFDANLSRIAARAFPGSGPIDRVRKVGEFALTPAQTATTPLLVVAEVEREGKLADRTFYFVNYEAIAGSLFRLPRTRLELRVEAGKAVVTNRGEVPAAAVEIRRPGRADTFTAEDNHFWLEPGETREVGVSETGGLEVGAWNGEE